MARTAGISSEAVRKATGRTWAGWLRLLDKAGAKKMAHREIALLLHEKEGVGPWWCQMVTVGYEQARGLRQKHQKADGFSMSASRTVGVPVARLFAAWADARRRAGWLQDAAFTVRKATRPRSMRITWVDGRTNVEANFMAKGTGRSAVAVEHNKLASAREVTRLKSYWGRQLDQLKELLES